MTIKLTDDTVSEKKIASYEVEEGYVYPDIKLPSDTLPGTHHLTAQYVENDLFLASFDRARVYHGSKTYVHCPPVYLYKDREDNLIPLHATIFSANKRVETGKAKFKINKFTVSKERQEVVHGYVSESFTEYNISQDSEYTCVFEGQKDTNISEGRDDGSLMFVGLQGRIPLTVSVRTILAVQNEVTELVARVHHQDYGEVINYGDVPRGGTIDFIVNGVLVGSSEINSSGFASIKYNTSGLNVGVYDIVAVFQPSFQIVSYGKMAGGGTLFVGNDTNKPKIVSSSSTNTVKGAVLGLEFSSDKTLDGIVQLFIDDIEVVKQDVEHLYFLLEFGIPSDYPVTPWAFSGYHNMYLLYTKNNGMEYYYPLNDLYIMIETKVEIEAVDTDDFKKIFTYDKNGNVVETTLSEDNIVVGDNITFLVSNIDNQSSDLVTDGCIDVTFKSKK